MTRSLILVPLTVVLLDAVAQQPDYAAMMALRSSSGFRAALENASARLAVDAGDGVAAGVRAFVYANAVDYLGMAPAEARESKERALAEALELGRNLPWTHAAYALIRLAEDPIAAERELERCAAEHPEFIECHNLHGDLLRKTGRQEQAGAVYLGALQRWPRDGELLVSYALHLQETGNVTAALRVLSALIEDQPNFARGRWHFAVMLYETNGDLVVAREAAKRALELDPLIWNGNRLIATLDSALDRRNTAPP